MAKKASSKKSNNASLKWFRNVGQSLGYASADLIDELIPASSEFLKDNFSTTRDLVSDMRQNRTGGGIVAKQLDDNKYVKIGQDALKNAVKDIKSGKIYNKDRIDKFYGSSSGVDDFMFGDEDFSFDDDLDFGDDSIEIIENDDENTTNIKRVNTQVVNNNINNSISAKMFAEAMGGNTEVIATGFETLNQNQVNIASKQMMVDSKFSQGMINGLSTINDNLSLLVQFQSDNMTKYITSSLKYYEDNLNAMNSTLDTLKNSALLSGASLVDGKKNVAESINPLLASGGLDIQEYIKLVKSNFKEISDSNLYLSSIKMMFEDDDMYKEMAASPFKFLAGSMFKNTIPNFFKNTLKNVDKTFSSFFPALLGRFNYMKNDYGTNGLVRTLGELFGFDNKIKKTVNLGDYNRGVVGFDGESKMALVRVIPTYLRKITSALTGSEEKFFDYDKGKFKGLKEIKDDFEGNKRQTILSSYSSTLSKLKDRSNALEIGDTEERLNFFKEMEDYFINMTTSGTTINPFTRIKNGEEIDETSEFISDQNKPYFEALMRSLSKGDLLSTVGANMFSSRKDLDNFFKTIQDNPSAFNAFDLFSGAGFNDVFDKKGSVKQGSIGYGVTDKYKMSANDYLRDIRSILANGIVTYPRGGGNGPDDDNPINPNSKFIEKASRESKKYKDRMDSLAIPSRTSAEHDRAEALQKSKGFEYVRSMYEIDDYSNKDLDSIINRYVLDSKARDDDDDEDYDTTTRGGLLGLMSRAGTGKVSDSLNKTFNKPIEVLNNSLTKIDNSMYDLIFGKSGSDDDDDESYMDKAINKTKAKFTKYQAFLYDKVFNPIKEGLVGENGILTKFKNSEFYRNITMKKDRMINWLLGEKIDDKRSGGFMSETYNSIKDVGRSINHVILGKAYTDSTGTEHAENKDSLASNVKRMYKDGLTTAKSFMFGDKSEDGTKVYKEGIFKRIGDSFSQGFDNFRTELFGKPSSPANKFKAVSSNLIDDIKDNAPQIGAGAVIGAGAGLFSPFLGTLGSLLLPGGPIGGAIVGSTAVFLGKNEKFMNWMFGEKDPGDNNKRLGGIISSKTQEFFSKNKSVMGLGATAGLLSSMFIKPHLGVLGSFIMPGGPIGGAMLGTAAAIGMNSDKFQKWMFGDGIDDKGFAAKIANKFSTNKDKVSNSVFGASVGAMAGLIGPHMGVLGSFLLPGGPVGGAMLGLASGIAISSDKFKQWFLGDIGDDNKRKGGFLTKTLNFMDINIKEPIKHGMENVALNMERWFYNGITAPIIDSMQPIKDGIVDAFKNGWDKVNNLVGNVFKDHVAKPFGETMDKFVLTPMKKFMSKMLGAAGKVFGAIATSPFKLIGYMGGHAQKRKDASMKNKFGIGEISEDEYIDYISTQADRKTKRDERKEAMNKKFADKKAKLNEKKESLKTRKANSKLTDYAQSFKTEKNIEKNTDKTNKILMSINSKLNSTFSKKAFLKVANSHASGIDNVPEDDYEALLHEGEMVIPADQANIIREAFGQVKTKASRVKGPKNKSNKFVNSIGSEVNDNETLLTRIARDTKVIASEVKGQLDGVGSNAYKTRKILQKFLRIDDKDIGGSGNKDRVGIWGKIKRFFYKPTDFFKDLYGGLKDTVFGFPKKVLDKFFGENSLILRTFDFIADLPGQIMSGIKTIGSNLVNLTVDLTKQGSKLMFNVLDDGRKIFFKGLDTSIDILKEASLGILSGGMKLAGKLGDIVDTSLNVAGKAIGSFAEDIGKAASFVKDSVFDMVKGMYTFGKDVVTGAYGIGKDIFGAVYDKTASIVDRFKSKDGFRISNKKPINVIVQGGTLDTVYNIKNVEKLNKYFDNDKKANAKKPIDTNTAIQQLNTITSDKLDTIANTLKSNTLKVDVKNITDLKPTGDIPKESHMPETTSDKVLNISKFKGKVLGAEEEKKQEKKAKVEEKFKEASRKDAKFMQAENAKKDKEAKVSEWMGSVSGNVAAIAETNKKTSSMWDRIFGKNGIASSLFGGLKGLGKLIAGGTIAFDLIKSFIQSKNNGKSVVENWMGGADPERVDADGESVLNYKKGELGARALVKPASKAVNKAFNVSGTVKKGASKVASAIDHNFGTNIVQNSKGRKLGKSMNRMLRYDAMKETAGAIADKGKSKIKYFLELVEKAIDIIVGKVATKFPSATKASATIKSMIKFISGKADDVAKKYLPKITATIAESTAGMATGMTLDVALGAWDATTGFFEAANLFKVNQDEVDTTMRFISSVVKLATKFGWIQVVYLFNEILADFKGIDFISYMAVEMYKAIPWTDGDSIDKKREDFKKEVEAYNAENGTDLSLEAYNDKMNQTVAGKIMGSKPVQGVKDYFSKYSTRQTLGMDKDTKLTWGDRWQNTKAQTKSKIYNLFHRKKNHKEASDFVNEGYLEKRNNKIESEMHEIQSQLGNRQMSGRKRKKLEKRLKKLQSQRMMKNGSYENLQNGTDIVDYSGYDVDSVYENQLDGNVNQLADNQLKMMQNYLGKYSQSGAVKSKVSDMQSYDMLDDDISRLRGVGGGYGGNEVALEQADKINDLVSKNLGKTIDTLTPALGALPETTAMYTKHSLTEWNEHVETSVEDNMENLNKASTNIFDTFKSLVEQVESWSHNIHDDASGIFSSNKYNRKTSATKLKSDSSSKKKSSKKTTKTKKKRKKFLGIFGGGFGEPDEKALSNINNVPDMTDPANIPQYMKNKVSGKKQQEPTNTNPLASLFEFPGNDKDKGKELDKVERPKSIKDIPLDKQTAFNIGSSKKMSFKQMRMNDQYSKINKDLGQCTDCNLLPEGLKQFNANNMYNYTGSYPGTMNGFAYYSQNDPRWSDTIYKDNAGGGMSIGYSGCGPTSVAMIMSQLTGKKYTPPILADLASQGGYNLAGAGTSFGFYPAMAQLFKMNYKELGADTNSILNFLDAGYPAVLSGQSGSSSSPFTNEGHLVVATGRDGDDFIINDPRSPSHSKKYSSSTVAEGLMGGFGFSYAGSTPDVPEDGSYVPGEGGTGSSGSSGAAKKENGMYGPFEEMNRIVENFVASVYAGKEVDLYADASGGKDGGGNSSDGGSYSASSIVDMGKVTPDYLNKFLKNKFTNTGSSWYDNGKSFNVNPALAVAIANQETGYGSSQAVMNDNNVGGMMDPDSGWSTLMHFDSIDSGIRSMIRNLRVTYLDDPSMNSIEAVGGRYAPVGAANDPSGLNGHWVPNVKKMYKDIMGTDNVILTADKLGSGSSSSTSSKSSTGVMSKFNEGSGFGKIDPNYTIPDMTKPGNIPSGMKQRIKKNSNIPTGFGGGNGDEKINNNFDSNNLLRKSDNNTPISKRENVYGGIMGVSSGYLKDLVGLVKQLVTNSNVGNDLLAKIKEKPTVVTNKIDTSGSKSDKSPENTPSKPENRSSKQPMEKDRAYERVKAIARGV